LRLAVTGAKHIEAKRVWAACAGLLLCAALSPAQKKKSDERDRARPNLTGTWVLDEVIQGSVKTKNLMLEAGQVTLVISHRDPEIRMTRTATKKEGEVTQELVFYADGRGETNQGPALGLGREDISGKIKSSTVWKKTKLRTTSEVRGALQGDFYIVMITDEWELSADGQTLTQQTSVDPGIVSAGATVGARGSGPLRLPAVIIPGGGKIKKVYRRLSA
jgi:hypothetical protein